MGHHCDFICVIWHDFRRTGVGYCLERQPFYEHNHMVGRRKYKSKTKGQACRLRRETGERLY